MQYATFRPLKGYLLQHKRWHIEIYGTILATAFIPKGHHQKKTNSKELCSCATNIYNNNKAAVRLMP